MINNIDTAYQIFGVDNVSNEREREKVVEAVDRWCGAIVLKALEVGFLEECPDLKDRIIQGAMENRDLRVLNFLNRTGNLQ